MSVASQIDTPERLALRATVRRFTEQEVVPNLGRWEREGEVPRSLHRSAAAAGLLGVGFPVAVGGEGGDLVDALVVTEELITAGGSSGLVAALMTHGIALPHILAADDARQVGRWVRPTLAGDLIGSLAVTEPGGGSDVGALRTTARREGDHYIVDGAKTYITSGTRADFITTAVRTGSAGAQGVSLLVIERGTPGLTVSEPLAKTGWLCSDTAELSFAGCAVPAGNLVGAEGAGFAQIAQHFQAERISLAVQAYATAQRCLDLTLAWVRQRETFGRPLVSRQVVRHTLVGMRSRIDVARTFTRDLALRVATGEEDIGAVCVAKSTACEACDWVVHQAVQLHGGVGLMRESEVDRHARDSRILSIGGGATEVMTDLAARRWGW